MDWLNFVSIHFVKIRKVFLDSGIPVFVGALFYLSFIPGKIDFFNKGFEGHYFLFFSKFLNGGKQ